MEKKKDKLQNWPLRSFHLRVVSPTVCSSTSRVDSPTSIMSARLPLKLCTMTIVDSPTWCAISESVDLICTWFGKFKQQLLEFYTYGLANPNNDCCLNSPNHKYMYRLMVWRIQTTIVAVLYLLCLWAPFLERGIFTCLFICVRVTINT